MKIKLIVSDVDGTIIDKNNIIPQKNFEAIQKINKKNIPFAICTGKSFSVSNQFFKYIRASYGIFGNGTQIIDLKTNKELFRSTLSLNDCFLF